MRQLAIAAALLAAFAGTAHAGKTLDAIKARGQVVCGVNTGLAGFGAADSAGKWNGLDVDICRAVAAAVLSDGEKVKLQLYLDCQAFSESARAVGVEPASVIGLSKLGELTAEGEKLMKGDTSNSNPLNGA